MNSIITVGATFTTCIGIIPFSVAFFGKFIHSIFILFELISQLLDLLMFVKQVKQKDINKRSVSRVGSIIQSS